MVFAEIRAADAGDCGTDGMQSWNGTSHFITVKISVGNSLLLVGLISVACTGTERSAAMHKTVIQIDSFLFMLILLLDIGIRILALVLRSL